MSDTDKKSFVTNKQSCRSAAWLTRRSNICRSRSFAWNTHSTAWLYEDLVER